MMSSFQKQSMAVNVRMTPSQHRKIQEAAKAESLPMKEFMLAATLKHIAEQDRRNPPQDQKDPHDAF